MIDGDTYEVDRPAGSVVKVRLWGVDAPEFDQPYGVKARDAAVRYIARKTVGVARLQHGTAQPMIRTARILAASAQRSGSTNAINQGTLTTWTGDRYGEACDSLSKP